MHENDLDYIVTDNCSSSFSRLNEMKVTRYGFHPLTVDKLLRCKIIRFALILNGCDCVLMKNRREAEISCKVGFDNLTKIVSQLIKIAIHPICMSGHFTNFN